MASYVPPKVTQALPPFHLDADNNAGIFHVEKERLTKEKADTVCEILKINHTAYHIFLLPEHDRGAHLHNHIVHQFLALWALGCEREMMWEHYAHNTSYLPKALKAADSATIADLARPFSFQKHLGNEYYYQDYVHHFENEIHNLGYEEVLQRYLVGGSPIAEDILPRIWMGYLHSWMHIGMALEFKQPKILAEGLAQSCVHHDYWYNEFISATERVGASPEAESALPLSDCVDLCRADPVVRRSSSVDYHQTFEEVETGPKMVMRVEFIKDGVLANAWDEMVAIASRYRVDPNDLDRATAELMNTIVYYASAAQRPPYQVRYDFFLMHALNASFWHSAVLEEPSMTNAQKARILEQSGRVFLLYYAGMVCPEPRMDWLLSQKPMVPDCGWDACLRRAARHLDDGHVPKTIRTIAQCQRISEPYDDRPEFRMKQYMFLPTANATLDAVKQNNWQPMVKIQHHLFIRGCGEAKAWKDVLKREGYEEEEE